MPKSSENAKPGLGTGIFQALARQLLAQVKVTDAKPSTAVTITHAEVGVDSGAKVTPLVNVV
jgi:two-component system, sensor histidine kinase PdtaS